MIAEEQGTTTPNYERETLKLDLGSADLFLELETSLVTGQAISNFDEF